MVDIVPPIYVNGTDNILETPLSIMLSTPAPTAITTSVTNIKKKYQLSDSVNNIEK